jgi:hypothetical protein
MSLPFPPWGTDENQTQQSEAHLDNIEPDFVITHPLDFDMLFDLSNAENLSLGSLSDTILNDKDIMSTDVGHGSGDISKNAMVNVPSLDPFLQDEFGLDVTFPEIRLSEVMITIMSVC